MAEIIGVTFPIPKSYILRFFKEGKTVFIKPATTFKALRAGMKFVFYQSHEDTGCVGEALIKQIIVAEDPFSFFELFDDRIFITQDELKRYIETNKKWKKPPRKGKDKPRSNKWIAIELESIREYDNTKKPRRFVTVGGRYLEQEPQVKDE